MASHPPIRGQSQDQAKLGKIQGAGAVQGGDKAAKLEDKVATGDAEMDRVISENMFSLYCIWAESKLIRVSIALGPIACSGLCATSTQSFTSLISPNAVADQR